MDIIRLDRMARLEMMMKRDEFVALIFSDVAIYLIAAYLPEAIISLGKTGSAYSSRAFREKKPFRTFVAKGSKIKNSPFHARSLVSHSLSLSLSFSFLSSLVQESSSRRIL